MPAEAATGQVRFFNTLGRRLVDFELPTDREVGIYTCGPTVYDTAHIGNLRTFLFEDLLCRALEFLGFEVHQVMNLTDVEDKIIRRAGEMELSIEAFVAPHIEAFFRDLDRLHIRRAREYPRATEHIALMTELVSELLAKGYAYEVDGSVFFRIDRDEDYGRLSGIEEEELRRGERVADDEYEKEDARDFVLWKAAKPDEPSWPSPWGPGRPGWHIECSAMSMKYLGPTFDIHCGGVDNIFPHHENEIAQSESATGLSFARYWLHSEHLLVDGEKMAKSLGNQYTLDDLVERELDLRAVRYLLLSVHYRQKLNFTFDSVEGSAGALRRIDELRFRLENSTEAHESVGVVEAVSQVFLKDFGSALADDLNISAALGALHSWVRRINAAIEAKEVGKGDKDRVASTLCRADGVLGVLLQETWVDEAEGEASDGLDHKQIEDLLSRRTEARRRRDFAAADQIRNQLSEAGIVVEDTPQGPRWRRD